MSGRFKRGIRTCITQDLLCYASSVVTFEHASPEMSCVIKFKGA